MQADIWSLGITALELYKGFPPYAHCEPMEAIIRTCQGVVRYLLSVCARSQLVLPKLGEDGAEEESR